MNVQAILDRVNRRLPGYAPSELLDEINDAYQQCWDLVLQLDDSYFTDIKTVTTTAQNSEFDFFLNTNNALNNNVSLRYFQIDRIRVLQPGDSYWIPAQPRPWNDPALLSISSLTPQNVQMRGPYLYTLLGKGSVKFGNVFPVGTQFEVVYTFTFLPLTILSNGSISSSGISVTGTGTNFFDLVGPDFPLTLSLTDEDTSVGMELIVNGRTYTVDTISSNTTLVTLSVIAPAAAGANYVLAMVPDIPYGYHDVIALIATRNVMSTPGSDPRLGWFTQQAKERMDAMRDGIMTRQRQEPPRRRRFSQSLLRYYGVGISR